MHTHKVLKTFLDLQKHHSQKQTVSYLLPLLFPPPLPPPSLPGEELGRWGNLVLLVESHKARVRRQKMREVVQLHHFQVNNLLDGAYQPRPCGLIVEEALGMVGEELLYCLYTYNCEHFVTWLRYGRAESRQVRRPPAPLPPPPTSSLFRSQS